MRHNFQNSKRFISAMLVLVMVLSTAMPIFAAPSAVTETDSANEFVADVEMTVKNEAHDIIENCHTLTREWFGDVSVLSENPDNDEVILNAYFDIRQASFFSANKVKSDILSREICENEEQRRKDIADMQKNMIIDITDAVTTIQIGEKTENKDGSKNVAVYEWTFFDYDDLRVEGVGLNTSGYGVDHVITIANGKITKDEYHEEVLHGFEQSEEDRVQESEGDVQLSAGSFYATYDVVEAVAYSDKYAMNYNTAYYNFNSVGGDCTNFTSQCIYAGGMPQVVGSNYGANGWFYKASNNRSATWTSAGSLKTWMGNNRGVAIEDPAASQIYKGSPVFYDVGHSAFCVGKNSEGTPIVNGHNQDVYHAVWTLGYSVSSCSTVQLTSSNEDYIAKGICGDNLTWTLGRTGTLTISGSGDMYDYASNTSSPWFNNYPSITAIVIGNGVTSIGNGAFGYCNRLKSITIGNSVRRIGDGAFYQCSNIKSIAIPGSVTDIGKEAFYGCSSLTGITIPQNVSSIGDKVFYGCISLTGITIPQNISSIGDGAFMDCRGITSITIPAGVMSIGNNVFDSCSNLANITVDKANNYYCSQDGVLFDKTKMILYRYPEGKQGTSYIVPDSVSFVGDSAFSGNDYLTTITIPDSVTTIGDRVFLNCMKLESLTVGYGVTSIGQQSFWNCLKLANIYYKGNESEWNAISVGLHNEDLDEATLHYDYGKIFVTYITLDKTTAEMTVGDMLTLTATIAPANATNKAVTWKSSNTSVATVSNGAVTAANAGTATITVTTEDGSKTAFCVVTVSAKPEAKPDPKPPVEADIVFGLGRVSGRPGDTVKVPLVLDNDKVINSIAINNIGYDRNNLEFVGFEKNAEFVSGALFKQFDEEKMTIAIGWMDKGAYNGEICSIIFKIKQTASEGAYDITAESVVKDSSLLFTSGVNDGAVSVMLRKPGDIDGDDDVTIDDAILLFQHSMMPGIYDVDYSGSMDFDKDGSVDINDAILLFQHSMMPETYPLG